MALAQPKGVPSAALGPTVQITNRAATLWSSPDEHASIETQVLFGETVSLLQEEGPRVRVRCTLDGYEGYLDKGGFSMEPHETTHRVAVPRTAARQEPKTEARRVSQLGMNALVRVTDIAGMFARIEGLGWMPKEHLLPKEQFLPDFVRVAEMLERGTPYEWGCRDPVDGLDCSALLQLSLIAAGKSCPRNSKEQSRVLGSALPTHDLDDLKRGDLIFWKGHVGIMVSPYHLLHATGGEHMRVVRESLREVYDRRHREGRGVITGVRRIY